MKGSDIDTYWKGTEKTDSRFLQNGLGSTLQQILSSSA